MYKTYTPFEEMLAAFENAAVLNESYNSTSGFYSFRLGATPSSPSKNGGVIFIGEDDLAVAIEEIERRVNQRSFFTNKEARVYDLFVSALESIDFHKTPAPIQIQPQPARRKLPRSRCIFTTRTP